MKSLKALPSDFDVEASRSRCRQYRRRILDVSQKVQALHIAPAFSCLEIVDCIYNGLMRRAHGHFLDTFVLSKGHGAMAQYAVLEELGILPRNALDSYGTKDGILGAHPDYGCPGIAASTGSLGHGLSMSLGIAVAERNIAAGNLANSVYCVISDGELQEGSTWEAIMMASSLSVTNLVVFVDNNDFQSLGRTSETHPSFYPLIDKFVAFGWEAVECEGHDTASLIAAVHNRRGDRPLMVVARTTKGKGVHYMENVPIWHCRSPNQTEYEAALSELAGDRP